jgi:hypothetical protein
MVWSLGHWHPSHPINFVRPLASNKLFELAPMKILSEGCNYVLLDHTMTRPNPIRDISTTYSQEEEVSKR